MLKIYVKKLNPEAALPKRAHPTDEGADLYACTRRLAAEYSDSRVDVFEYGTGLTFAIPKGYALDLRARSSIWKKGMMLCNGVGTIDQTYRDEVKAFFYAFSRDSYDVGDRVAQLLIRPYVNPEEIEFVEVDELPSGDDRGGGFGSTGEK